ALLHLPHSYVQLYGPTTLVTHNPGQTCRGPTRHCSRDAILAAIIKQRGSRGGMLGSGSRQQGRGTSQSGRSGSGLLIRMVDGSCQACELGTWQESPK